MKKKTNHSVILINGKLECNENNNSLMSNQHIQKQIELLENADIWREVEDDSSIGDGGSHSEIDLDKVIAIFKTSLERVWEEAERETIKKVEEAIDKEYQDFGWDDGAGNHAIQAIAKLQSLKQTT